MGSQTLNPTHSGLFWNTVDVISGYFWYFLLVTNCYIILQLCFVNQSTCLSKKDKFQVCSGFISSVMKVYRFEDLMVTCQWGSCDTCKMVIQVWWRILLPAMPLPASSLDEIAEYLRSFNKQVNSKDMRIFWCCIRTCLLSIHFVLLAMERLIISCIFYCNNIRDLFILLYWFLPYILSVV